MADDYGIPPHERQFRRIAPARVDIDQNTNPVMSFFRILDAVTEDGGGLALADVERLEQLLAAFDKVSGRNRRLMRYYNSEITLPEVNLGFALDERLAKSLDVRCGWPNKAVSCLVTRSVFDGYVASDDVVSAELHAVVRENQLLQAVGRAKYSEAALGVTFATLSWDEHERARIRFHTAQSAVGVWDGAKGRLAYGLAIIDSAKYNGDTSWQPSVVNLYTDDHIVVFTRTDGSNWRARYVEHNLGRPPMVAFVNSPTDRKPFGSSRITPTVMSLTDEAIRTLGRLSMSAELFTYPQKFILGLADNLISGPDSLDTFALAMNKVIKLSSNPESGDNPEVKQFPASSIEPHAATLRSLATLFSGETACPVNELGVIQDNPSSAESILASKEALVTLVESFNATNAVALYNVGLMALAINLDEPLDALPSEYYEFEAHHKSPTLASMAAQADAVIKIASVDPSFAGTHAFYSLLGLDEPTIQQIQDEKSKNAGQALLNEILGGGGNGTT